MPNDQEIAELTEKVRSFKDDPELQKQLEHWVIYHMKESTVREAWIGGYQQGYWDRSAEAFDAESS